MTQLADRPTTDPGTSPQLGRVSHWIGGRVVEGTSRRREVLRSSASAIRPIDPASTRGWPLWTVLLVIAGCSVAGAPRTTDGGPTLVAPGTDPAETSGTLTSPPSPIATAPASPSSTPSRTRPPVGLVACYERMGELMQRPPETPPAVRAEVTWARAISSTPELVEAADIIVVGVLGRGMREWTPPPESGPTEEPSDFKVVERDFLTGTVLKGDLAVGSTIEVLDRVRRSDGARFLERDARPLEVGRRYLLFLREGPGGGIWSTVNGPLGQFEVEDDGTVRMMTTCYESGLDLDGETLLEAVDLIESYVP